MKTNAGDSPSPGGLCMKSSMSLPDVKMPGCPVSSTARTAGSATAASIASAIARYIACVIAFFFSGRAISIVATPFRVAVLMLIRSPRSDPFEDARRTLTGADAHRDHAVLEVVAAQGMHDRRRADRTGRAERVAERDRAAHRIDLRAVELDGVDDRERLRRERLVQLEPVHVVDLQAGIAQRGRNRLDRADAHDLGRH